MDLKKKALIIGIDGAPYTLIERYLEDGVVPNLRRILSKGHGLSQMDASIPDVSSTSWTTFFTGVNPGEHGIFGFIELKDNSYKIAFPNYLDIKAPSIWEIIGGDCNSKKSSISNKYSNKLTKGLTSIVLNIPQTYPAVPLNGALTAGFVCPDLRKGTYPPDVYDYLKAIGYVPDIDADKALKDPQGFFADIDMALDKRLQAYQYLMKNKPWDLFIACFTETDRMHHYFYDSAYDESHAFHKDFVSVYKKLDDIIGRLYDDFMARTSGNGLFMTMSDHGFTAIKKEVYLNAFLKDSGFLRLNRQREYFEQIDSGTKAFCLDPARIYINRQGRYPLGSVKADDEAGIKRDLTALLKTLADTDGSPVVKCVYDGNDIYKGGSLEKAPSIVCIGSDGYDLKGNLKKDEVFGISQFRGMHTRHDAHCIMPSFCDKADRLNIQDLALIIMENII